MPVDMKHPSAAQDRRDEVRERLTGSRAGFRQNHAPLFEGIGNCSGHLYLTGRARSAGATRQRAIWRKYFDHALVQAGLVGFSRGRNLRHNPLTSGGLSARNCFRARRGGRHLRAELFLCFSDLVDSALVPTTFERCREPGFEDFVGEPEGDDAPTMARTFASLCWRERAAVNRSLQRAARTPGTLFAAICSP